MVLLTYLEIPAGLLSAPDTIAQPPYYHYDNDLGNHVIPNSNGVMNVVVRGIDSGKEEFARIRHRVLKIIWY